MLFRSPPSLTISDNGPGVPIGEREAIFDRFHRGSTAVGQGSGLGLTIVREIAQLHSAHTYVTETAGGGVTIELRF